MNNIDNLNDIDNLNKKEQRFQRICAEIDLDAIESNIESIKQNIAPSSQIMAVVKADGYGHGSIPIARYLEKKEYLFGFAVATAEEAYCLRKAGIRKPILVLGYTFPYSYEKLIEEEIRFTVFRQDMVEELLQAGIKAGKKAKVHIKVDTGMGRIGIFPNQEGLSFIRKLKKMQERENGIENENKIGNEIRNENGIGNENESGIEIEGIFTHFSKADEADQTVTKQQLTSFLSFVKQAEKELGRNIPFKHCSNSAGISELPQANLDFVRAGIALYGIYPSKQVNRKILTLTPAFSLYSHIVLIKPLLPGQSVSYGGIFTAKQPMRIATIPVGYGDGYPRSLSEKGYVLIRGKKAPILGRICMDQFMVDVTFIPEAKEGDLVTLLGKDGEETITAEELADISGRFPYEFMCDLGKRIPRCYLKDQKIVETEDYFQLFSKE